MKFSVALYALEEGRKVTRTGWNGKGQFVYLVPADKYPAKTDAAKSIADENGLVSYRPYFALRTAQGDVSTWVPSVSDCLADDWEVLEEDSPKEEEQEVKAAIDELAELAAMAFILDLVKKAPVSPEKCEKCSKKDKCERYAKYLKEQKNPKDKGGKK